MQEFQVQSVGLDRRLAVLSGVILCLSLFVGCEEKQKANADSDAGLKMKDLATPLPKPDATVPAPPLAKRKLVVQALAFESPSGRLDVAMEMLGPLEIDPKSRELWRHNGLLIAALDPKQLDLFLGNLPKPIHSQTLRSQQLDTYTSLELPGNLIQWQTIEIRESPRHVHQRRVNPRMLRWLIRMLPSVQADGVELEILPHYYIPRPTAELRPPQERMLDGIRFEALSISHDLTEDRLWVITTPTQPAQPAGPQDDRPWAGGASPATLGQAMLSHQQKGKAVHWLLLIGLEKPAARVQ